MKTKHHPEQQEDEIFMGNATAKEFGQYNWSTKRIGFFAYMADDTKPTVQMVSNP